MLLHLLLPPHSTVAPRGPPQSTAGVTTVVTITGTTKFRGEIHPFRHGITHYMDLNVHIITMNIIRWRNAEYTFFISIRSFLFFQNVNFCVLIFPSSSLFFAALKLHHKESYMVNLFSNYCRSNDTVFNKINIVAPVVLAVSELAQAILLV